MLGVAESGNGSAKERGAGEVPTLAAAQMGLVELTEAIIRLMRIDQQHGLAGARFAAGDCPGVASRGLAHFFFEFSRLVIVRHAAGRDVHVPADQFERGSAGKGQQVPGFEACQQARLDGRVRVEIVVDSADKGAPQAARFRIELFEILFRALGNFECPVAHVLGQKLLAIQLAVTAEPHDVRIFDLPEVVLGLAVAEAEQDGLIGRAIDVRHSPAIAIDRHAAGQFAKVGAGRRRRGLCPGRVRAGHDSNKHDHLQDKPPTVGAEHAWISC